MCYRCFIRDYYAKNTTTSGVREDDCQGHTVAANDIDLRTRAARGTVVKRFYGYGRGSPTDVGILFAMYRWSSMLESLRFGPSSSFVT
jgi:hypothetical protein